MIAMCCGIFVLSNDNSFITILIFITRRTLCFEAVGECELQHRIGIRVLQKSARRDANGVFYAVQLVACGEMNSPRECCIDALVDFIFYTDSEWNVGCEKLFLCSFDIGCAHTCEEIGCEALGMIVVVARALRPEMIFKGGMCVDQRVAKLSWIAAHHRCVCGCLARFSFQLADACAPFYGRIGIEIAAHR